MARIVVCWLWPWDSPLRRWCALVAVSVTAAAGCSAPGTAVENAPEVTVMSAGAVLRDPVWSYRIDALVGLTDDDRLAEITDLLRPGHATTRLSPPIAVGRNLQISRKDDRHIFVPQPQRGKVAVIDLATLRQVDEFDAGPAPAYLSEDSRNAGVARAVSGRIVGDSESTNTASGHCRRPRSPVIPRT